MFEYFQAGPPRPEGRSPPGNEERRSGTEAAPSENDRSSSNRASFKRPPAEAQEVALRRLQRQRQVAQIYRLGARVVFEFLDELDRHHGLGPDLDRRLARYAAADHELLRAVGADRFPLSPIRAVPR